MSGRAGSGAGQTAPIASEGFGSAFPDVVDTGSLTSDEPVHDGVVSGADSGTLGEEEVEDPQG